MKTFFSIIIPTYNRANLISETLKSVKEQTFKEWECIVVDDGSIDNTKEIVQKFIKEDNRFRYQYQENAERCVARNNGIKKANGEYICFLDSDDLYKDNHLEILFKHIKIYKFPKAMFATDVVRFQNNEYTQVLHQSKNDFSHPISYLLLAKETVIPARTCIEKNILLEFPFNENINISEDLELFSRILLKYEFIQVHENTVVYKLHNENSTNLNKNPYKGQLKSLNIIFANKKIRKIVSKSIRREKLSSCYFGIAKYHHFKTNPFRTTFYMFLSFIKKPNNKNNKNKLYLILEAFKNAIRSKK